MSVQVRRRREAASFLQSFVGAQGELLVDTTSNRLQVHDGATPGGWPAARIADLPGRNVLINGAFAVNQRGYASGATLGAGAYAHDRWVSGTAGTAYAFAQGVPDTTVTLTAGVVGQIVDAANVHAASWWLTWVGTAPARAFTVGTAAPPAFAAGTGTVVGGVAVNALAVSGLTIGAAAVVQFAAGTLGLAQLEAALPGAGPTRFERRHGELALCQRYFQTSYPEGTAPGTAGSIAPLVIVPSGSGSYTALATLAFPTPMRATPTVTLYAETTGAAGKLTSFNADIAALVYGVTAKGLSFGTNGVVPTAGARLSGHYTAAAEL